MLNSLPRSLSIYHVFFLNMWPMTLNWTCSDRYTWTGACLRMCLPLHVLSYTNTLYRLPNVMPTLSLFGETIALQITPVLSLLCLHTKTFSILSFSGSAHWFCTHEQENRLNSVTKRDKVTVCMYEIITMKSPHIINCDKSKIKIFLKFKKHSLYND
jgi:hypothetical protein